MSHPFLALESVTQVLADGRSLFSGLNERFDLRPTALVGRNGTGKSMLARILAGQLVPTAGRCVASGPVHYLAQQIVPAAGGTVADLAGVGPVLAALARIEAGSTDPQDFAQVGERWSLRAELHEALAAQGLPAFDLETPGTCLSGGQAMRVALAGAWLSDADFLVLDEPGNHLDLHARRHLLEQLRQWRRGLVLVSHDRTLLRAMSRIVELSPSGLRSYGGGWDDCMESRETDAAAAQRDLDHARTERMRRQREQAAQLEREQRRQSRSQRERRQANQAAILLDHQQQRSEHSGGVRVLQRQKAGEEADRQVREAAARVVEDAPVLMFAPLPAAAAQRRVAVLEDVELPFTPDATRRLSLAVSGTARIGITGGNGCGKSTLLRVLAGMQSPVSGVCRVSVPAALLDQDLSLLPPGSTALERLRQAAPAADEAGLRTRLAQLGLDAARIAVPARLLSGGERLKAALACVLYAAEPAQLLLLDEPDNHLDLPSKEALEHMLCTFPGALLVVSHDEAFLDRLNPDTRLQAGPDGWSSSPW